MQQNVFYLLGQSTLAATQSATVHACALSLLHGSCGVQSTGRSRWSAPSSFALRFVLCRPSVSSVLPRRTWRRRCATVDV